MSNYKKMFLPVLAMFLVCCVNTASTTPRKTEPIAIYVNPNGDDAATGTTPDKALKTLEGARDFISKHKLNKDMKADLYVYLAAGRYELDKTVTFLPEDSGSNGYSIIYRNFTDEKPIICGGRKLQGWEKVPNQDYYVADVSESKGHANYFKQLYVNGIRAQLAISNRTYRAMGAPKLVDIQTGKNGKVRKQITKHPTRHWWDNPETEAKIDGIEFSKEDMTKSYTNIKDIDVYALLVFKQLQISVEEIIETDTSYIFTWKNPDFLWWTTWVDASGAMGHFIVNAIEELDEPGEWCLNTTTNKVYYYPQPWEKMSEVEAYVPAVEGLIKLEGKPENRIKNIQFDGIIFQHGNWTYPEKHMLGRSQAEITGRYDSEVPGQIVLNYSDNIQIKNSVFRHMGSSGIQPYEGTDRTKIEGNIFYDLSTAAITTGKWYIDKLKCPSNSICTNTSIKNNVVRNIGRDYFQASAINTFAAYNMFIENNDISDIAYAGIHARIGDKPTHHTKIGRLTYRRNLLSRSSAMHKWGVRDGGTLYTHGYYPNCLVEENYVVYSSRNVMTVFYADNWSNDSRWQNNVSKDTHSEYVCRAWMPSSNRVIFDTHYADVLCPKTGGEEIVNFNYIENEAWPEHALEIMENAGLEDEYKKLGKVVYGHESLLKNKPVTFSSEEEDNPAQYGNDNDWNTHWHTSADSSGNAWYQVDMGSQYVIEKLVIIPVEKRFEPESRSNYEVQASNDKDFNDYTVLATKNKVIAYYKTDAKCSNMWEVFINNKKDYRYLRVVAKNEKSSFSMAEFEAFGYEK